MIGGTLGLFTGFSIMSGFEIGLLSSQDCFVFNESTNESKKTLKKNSGLGGTLGLFTGFSIMSGFEIVYYLLKIALCLMKAPTSPEKHQEK